MKQITDYEIVDHGVDHPQYFQGCGTTFSEFTDCVTGCGISAHEAFNDALDQAAMNDWCVDTIKNDMSDYPEADGCEHCESCADCEDQCGESNQYYVSIKLK